MAHLCACGRAIGAAVAFTLASAAGAQDTTRLEGITVTAQKREESLQEVPLAVSAVAGEKLAEIGIMKIADLSSYVPTLFMTETAIGNNLAIRGIFSGVNPGFEQSVGTYVDGIYRGRPQQARAPFVDVERIEVLRGPQSILFGKNSVAGALNITTARPTSDFSAMASVLYEPDFNDREFNGHISGPFTDAFRARLSARYRETDGHLRNLTLSRNEPQREETNLRLWLEWDATEAVRLSFKAEQGEYDVLGRQIEIYQETPIPAGRPFAGLTYSQVWAGPPFNQDPSVRNNGPDYQRSSNGDFSNNETDEYVFNIDWKLGEHTLTATSGYSKYEFDELCDCDFTGANIFNVLMQERFDQTSQEIRLASPTGGAVEYLVGAYYEKSDLTFGDTIQILPGSSLVTLVNLLSPGSGTLINNTATPRLFKQDSEAWSAFGQATWNLTDAFRATIGLRYTKEEKTASRNLRITDASGNPLTGGQAVGAPLVYAGLFNVRPHSLSGQRDEDQFLPSVIFRYDWGDNAMAYFNWSRGSKSGGFDARSNNPTVPPGVGLVGAQIGSFEFQDEEADSFELGAKTSFGGVFELNVAAFFTDYKDLQVSTFDGVLGFNVRNAGAAEIKGLEFDTRWRVTEHSLLSASMAFTDFEFKDYIGQCYFGAVRDAPDGINCNYKGKTNEFVADWVATLAYSYTRQISANLQFRFGLDLFYTTDTFVAPTVDPKQKQDAYEKLDGRVAIGADNWEVAVLGRNLTDQAIYAYGNDTPLSSLLGAFSAWRFSEPPRTFAIQGTVRF